MRWILLTLFFLGFFFRLWIINLIPQPFIFDQIQYFEYAKGIVNNGLYASSFRIYGYPLFIALINIFTGGMSSVDKYPWQLSQVLIDTLSAVLVYAVCQKITKNQLLVLIAYILYLFNPYTSSYTGVMLSEVLSGFILILLFYLLLIFLERKRIWLILPISLILGYLPQVRPLYLWFSIIVFLIIINYVVGLLQITRIRLVTVVISLFFFCLPFTYNVLGNYKYFGHFALMDVDNYFLENFYISLFIEKSPQTRMAITEYPKEAVWAYSVYTADFRDVWVRRQMQQYFIGLSLTEIKRDPAKFFIWRIKKLWYPWEKHGIYPYNNSSNPTVKSLTYWGNNLLILLAIIGLIRWVQRIRKNKDQMQGRFAILAILLVVYTTFANALTTSEERYSLPLYPFLFIFSVMGGYFLVKMLKSKKIRSD